MRELALAVCALLAFLIPVGCYCFILATINRRPRPVLASGVWDAVGLLAGASGFFLMTLPMLINELQLRFSGETGSLRDFVDASLRQWLLWLVYVLFLISGGAWLMLSRINKTMIYNVDTLQFGDGFKRALTAVGLEVRGDQKGYLTLAPLPPPAPTGETGITEATVRVVAPAVDASRQAVVEVEPFAAMCHVTLHWDSYAPHLRGQIETELAKALEMAAPEENPAAGWFLSVSGLVFGALFMIVVMVFVLVVFPR